MRQGHQILSEQNSNFHTHKAHQDEDPLAFVPKSLRNLVNLQIFWGWVSEIQNRFNHALSTRGFKSIHEILKQYDVVKESLTKVENDLKNYLVITHLEKIGSTDDVMLYKCMIDMDFDEVRRNTSHHAGLFDLAMAELQISDRIQDTLTQFTNILEKSIYRDLDYWSDVQSALSKILHETNVQQDKEREKFVLTRLTMASEAYAEIQAGRDNQVESNQESEPLPELVQDNGRKLKTIYAQLPRDPLQFYMHTLEKQIIAAQKDDGGKNPDKFLQIIERLQDLYATLNFSLPDRLMPKLMEKRHGSLYIKDNALLVMSINIIEKCSMTNIIDIILDCAIVIEEELNVADATLESRIKFLKMRSEFDLIRIAKLEQLVAKLGTQKTAATSVRIDLASPKTYMQAVECPLHEHFEHLFLSIDKLRTSGRHDDSFDDRAKALFENMFEIIEQLVTPDCMTELKNTDNGELFDYKNAMNVFEKHVDKDLIQIVLDFILDATCNIEVELYNSSDIQYVSMLLDYYKFRAEFDGLYLKKAEALFEKSVNRHGLKMRNETAAFSLAQSGHSIVDQMKALNEQGAAAEFVIPETTQQLPR